MSRHHWLCLIPASVLALCMLTACTIHPVTRLVGQAASSLTEAASAQPVTEATTVPTSLTPAELLARAHAAGDALSSATFVMTQATTYPGGSFAMTCDGVATNPFRGFTVCTANGVKTETVMPSASELYSRRSETTLWTGVPFAGAEGGFREQQDLSQFAQAAHLAGEESVAGIESYVVEYDIDLNLAMGENPEVQRYFDLRKSHATGSSWIGKEDYLTRRLEIALTLVGSGAEMTQETVILQGEFNQPAAIPEPVPAAWQMALSMQDPVFQVAFFPDGKTLAACDDDAVIYLWSMADPELGGAHVIGHPETLEGIADTSGTPKLLSKDFYALDFSPDSQTLAAGSRDEVFLYSVADPAAQPMVLAATHEGAPTHDIDAVAFALNGDWLAAGGDNGVIYLWATDELSATARILTGHDGAIRDLLFLAGGEILASASEDKTIRLWDMNDLSAEPALLDGHVFSVYNLAATPDARTLLSVGFKDPVYAWSIDRPGSRPDTLVEREIPAIGKAPTLAIALSPDGQLLATADVFGEVRLWHVPNFDEPYGLFGTGSQYDIMTVAFSADGRYLAAGQGNGAVYLWDLQPELAAQAEAFTVTTTADGPTVGELLARNAEVMVDLQSVQITTTFDRRNLDPSDPTAPAELEVVTSTYVYSAVRTAPLAQPMLIRVRFDVSEPGGPFIQPLPLLPLDGGYARSPQFEGVERIDGEEVYVVSFDVRLREFFPRLPSVVQTWLNSFATEVSGKVWIGVEDLRTRRLAYHVVLRTPWVDNRFDYTMHLGAFDEPVQIPAKTP